MRDYLSIMSDGEFTVTGYVLNGDPQEDGTPDWLTLPQTKSYYDGQPYTVFVNAALNAATIAGLNTSTNSTTKLAIIYAGHAYRGAGLWPRAFGNTYINGELFAVGPPFHSEHPNAKFQEIGINVHEFLHLAGLPDLGENGFFDVMSAGTYCGPNSRGACPAPLNPESRLKKGWVSFTPISQDQTFQSDYNLRDPEIFKITNASNSNYYWLFETRDFTSTMTIGTTVTDDYNSWIYKTFYSSYPDKGVMVWRVVSNYDHGTILQADGVRWTGYPQISKGTPFPGSGNVEVCSPWSDSRTYPSWVPNTKPSTNVGMEIVGEGSDWYLLDLYAVSPEDASPSKPQNLSVEPSANNHPYATWDANQEPDVLNGGYYNVWKKKFYSGAWHWDFLAQTNNNYYEDVSETYCSPGPCGNKEYIYYRVTAVDSQLKESVPSESVRAVVDGVGVEQKITIKNINPVKPLEYSLYQNYPNPFNPTTTITYSIQKDGLVSLKVYDILGKEVASLVNEPKIAGTYNVEFNASNLPSGIYFYILTSSTFVDTKKLILLK